MAHFPEGAWLPATEARLGVGHSQLRNSYFVWLTDEGTSSIFVWFAWEIVEHAYLMKGKSQSGGRN